VAVGYPLGAKSVTVTRGVVSNVHLSDLTLKVFGGQQMAVQIDAAINPGNSGGPVFNATTFALVGVAFAGRKNAEGQGFIIPIPVVNNFLKVFRTTGKPNPGLLPDLGVLVRSLENVQVCIQICEAACLGNINTKRKQQTLQKSSIKRTNLRWTVSKVPTQFWRRIDTIPLVLDVGSRLVNVRECVVGD